MSNRHGVAALLWAACIFVSSCTVVQSRAFVHAVANSAPGAITESGFNTFWRQWWWLFVKGFHFLEFAILTLLLGRWLRRQPIWIPVLLAAGYAATDEMHQVLVPERGALVSDWLIDCSGILAAALLIVLLRRREMGSQDLPQTPPGTHC